MKVVIVTLFLIHISISPAISIKETKIDYRCTEEFCREYRESEEGEKCDVPNAYCRKNSNGTRFPYPDTCNCCNYCFKNLEKGDDCVQGKPGSVSPMEMCGPGLQCGDDSKCERMVSDCTKDQDKYDQRKKDGDLGMMEIRPRCDGDGFYKPVHCIPGSICYCLDPTGKRIFGELPYLDYGDESKMSCECSRNAWKAQTSVYSKYRVRSARCTEIGTYDEMQCTMSPNSTCLCVDSENGSPIKSIPVVSEEDMGDNRPSCFDASRHFAGDYRTKCDIDYEEYLNYMTEDGKTDDELEVIEPFCDPDGSYGRMQSSGSKKICVDRSNRQIGRYEAQIDTTEAKEMNCNCARTRWLLEKAGVVELPACCSNGNFEKWQCRRNECFCVDDDGNQLGMEVSIKDKSKLHCYKDYDGKPCESIAKYHKL